MEDEGSWQDAPYNNEKIRRLLRQQASFTITGGARLLGLEVQPDNIECKGVKRKISWANSALLSQIPSLGSLPMSTSRQQQSPPLNGRHPSFNIRSWQDLFLIGLAKVRNKAKTSSYVAAR